MIVPELKKRNDVGIAVRLASQRGKCASGICNEYWECSDTNGYVLFGVKQQVDMCKSGEVRKIFLFADNSYERFLGSADVKRVICKKDPFNPVDIDKTLGVFQLNRDKKKECRTWFLLSNFKQIDIGTCGLRLMENPNVLFRDKMSASRFKMCYINLNNNSGTKR